MERELSLSLRTVLTLTGVSNRQCTINRCLNNGEFSTVNKTNERLSSSWKLCRSAVSNSDIPLTSLVSLAFAPTVSQSGKQL